MSGARTYVYVLQTHTRPPFLAIYFFTFLILILFFYINPHSCNVTQITVHQVTIITLGRGINRESIIHIMMLKSNYVQFAPDALHSQIKPASLLVENVMLLARWTHSTPTPVLHVALHEFLLAHSNIRPVIDWIRGHALFYLSHFVLKHTNIIHHRS